MLIGFPFWHQVPIGHVLATASYTFPTWKTFRVAFCSTIFGCKVEGLIARQRDSLALWEEDLAVLQLASSKTVGLLGQ